MTLFDEYPNLQLLNAYSKSVAQEIYNDYPHWMASALCDSGYLIITIPSSPAPTPRQLIISTHNEEITVKFAPFYHSHFDCWDCEQNEYFNLLADAKGFIEAVLAEELIIYWKVENDFTVYLGNVRRTELDSFDIEWTHMASWHGTFDKKKNISS